VSPALWPFRRTKRREGACELARTLEIEPYSIRADFDVRLVESRPPMGGFDPDLPKFDLDGSARRVLAKKARMSRPFETRQRILASLNSKRLAGLALVVEMVNREGLPAPERVTVNASVEDHTIDIRLPDNARDGVGAWVAATRRGMFDIPLEPQEDRRVEPSTAGDFEPFICVSAVSDGWRGGWDRVEVWSAVRPNPEAPEGRR
jgi:hypothetical protein